MGGVVASKNCLSGANDAEAAIGGEIVCLKVGVSRVRETRIKNIVVRRRFIIFAASIVPSVSAPLLRYEPRSANSSDAFRATVSARRS
jgi:hypothetical protein